MLELEEEVWLKLLDALPLSSRVQCLWVPQQVSGEYLVLTAVSMKAVWTVSWPGIHTVPGTLRPKSAASCLPPTCECQFWWQLKMGQPGPFLPSWVSRGIECWVSVLSSLFLVACALHLCRLYFLSFLPLPTLFKGIMFAFPAISGAPGSRTWSEGTQGGPAPMARGAGATGLRAALKSVSVGPWVGGGSGR